MLDTVISRTTIALLLVADSLAYADRFASAATVTLGAAKDAMIFQNNVDNGAGGAPGFVVGTNSQPSIRRGLIEFDLTPAASGIPAGSTITSVELRLKIGQTAGSGGGTGGGSSGGGGSTDPAIGLHKLLIDWGEAATGASTSTGLGGIAQGSPALPDDATWNNRFFGTPSPWGTPGGQAGLDYISAASASLVQSSALNAISLWLSTPQLVADVQSWLDNGATNFGWMLINTNETDAQTFRGFYSRNYNPDPAPPDLADFLPQLIINFVPEPSGIALLAIGAAMLLPLRRWRRRP